MWSSFRAAEGRPAGFFGPFQRMRWRTRQKQLVHSLVEIDKKLKMIERQIAHMVRLVDDLLDVSRITRGKVELHRRPLHQLRLRRRLHLRPRLRLQPRLRLRPWLPLHRRDR